MGGKSAKSEWGGGRVDWSLVIKLLSMAEWSELARVQDELARAEDLRQRERGLQQKMLYKKQLERMMEQRASQSRREEEASRREQVETHRTLNTLSPHSLPPINLQFHLHQSAHHNLAMSNEKKTRLKSELEHEKSILRQKYKKASTEISQQLTQQQLSQQLRQRTLAQHYQSQIDNHQSRKAIERLENQKFQQLARELESKKERERHQHINKIKYGYAQNPESFEYVKQLYQQTQEQKQNFIRKIETADNNGEAVGQKVRQVKLTQTIETGRFNKNNFLEKQFRRKLQQERELQEERNQVVFIQQSLTEEEEKSRQKKQQHKQILKTVLQQQITQAQQNRLRHKRMSEQQTRINRGYLNHDPPLALPGIARDHTALKKQLIIDSFLSNLKSTHRPSYPVHYSLEK